jgi:hypothetical protein
MPYLKKAPGKQQEEEHLISLLFLRKSRNISIKIHPQLRMILAAVSNFILSHCIHDRTS